MDPLGSQAHYVKLVSLLWHKTSYQILAMFGLQWQQELGKHCSIWSLTRTGWVYCSCKVKVTCQDI